MQCQDLKIPGLRLFRPRVFSDHRGFFTERFRTDVMAKYGVNENWCQDNFSRSNYKVLRGLHYQWEPLQGKLVTCTRGKIFDVAVDLRANSPTFGEHLSIEINGDEPAWFWIPAGFAHGFQVLSPEGADIMYKVNSHWGPQGESGIVWNDPALKIAWPLQDPILSDKDTGLGSLAQYRSAPRFT